MSAPTEKPIDPPSAPVVPPKKRRKPSSTDYTSPLNLKSVQDSPSFTPCGDDIQQPALMRHQSPSQQASVAVAVAVAAAAAVPQSTPPLGPAVMALPPPLLSPYPYAQLAPSMPYYHPLYPAGPFYLPVGSSPPLTPQLRPRSGSQAGNATRILPKAALSDATTSSPIPSQSFFASPPLHPNHPEYVYHHHHPQHPFNTPIAPAPPGPSSSSNPGERGREGSTADQREQARKVSHSAIERRRRERINDKIVQLRQLIPSCSNQEHLHKMTVLQSAIDYIGYLKDVISRLDSEEVQDDLKDKLLLLPKEAEQTRNSSPLSFMGDPTVATTTPPTPEHEIGDKGRTSGDEEETVPTHNQKGIKPIDVIRAGTASSAVTPVPSPSSVYSQEWSSSAPTSLPPPLLTKVPGPSSLPDNSTHNSEPSPVWSEDGSASPILPAPSLTSQPVSHQKNMSVENLLC